MKFYSFYAKRELKLNKFKSFLTIVSLSLSTAVCLCLFVYINKYNYDISEDPVKGVEIRFPFQEKANALDMELSYDYQFGLDQDVIDKIKEIPNIDYIIAKHYWDKGDYLLAVNIDKLKGYLQILHSEIKGNRYNDREENYAKLIKLGLNKDLCFLGKYSPAPCVETYDDYVFSYLEQHLDIGSINLNELKAGNEVILCLPPIKANMGRFQKVIPFYMGKHLQYEENTLKPGDTVTLVRVKPIDINQDYYKAKADLSKLVLEQRKVKIGGIIKKAGYFQLLNGDYHKIIDTPLVYVHNDAMAKWTGIKQYGEIKLVLKGNAKDSDIEKEVRKVLVDYNNVYISHQTNFEQAVKRNKVQSTLVHLPLIVITSILSILTVWITVSNKYEVKKRQFGILRSVGLTKQQFKKILNYQAILYGLSSGVIATVITIFYALFIYYQLFYSIRMYKWWNLVPWSFIPILTLVSIALVYIINNALFKKDLSKSIIENLRYME